MPLGIVAGVGAADRGGVLQTELAAQMPDQSRHAMRLHRGQQRIEASGGEPLDLLQGAGAQHGVETGIDAGIEFVALGREKHGAKAVLWQQRRLALMVPIQQRAAGRLDHLQRTRDPRSITQVQAVRGAQHAEINGSFWGFRLGPFFELPLTGPWEAQFGAGLAIVHVDATLEYVEKFAVTGTGGAPPEVNDSQDTHAWLAGFYLEAKVQYWFNPVIAAYIGGQYQMVDDLTLRAFGKEATLDFGSAFGLVFGVTYSF